MISVIVPVYNGSAYIERCINSITGSTFRDIEIIAVENGSTDNTWEVLEALAAGDSRIKPISTEIRGLSNARNIGIDHASGDWIAFVDADDYISPLMYERLAEAAQTHGADLVLCDFAQAFDAKHGYLTNKSIVVENMLSKNLVQSRSAAFSAEREMPSDGSIRLLSIGRFCAAKNFDNVPDICRRILASGCNVKWYLIGYGGDEALIRQRIQDAGMEERVIILGKKENPYPYIKACGLYVQPSRYEGKSVTVREAQILNKPVVITSYATSASQLEDGVDGVIVPMDNEGCAAGIAAVLRDEALRQKLTENTKIRDYTNAGEIEKIYRLLENV